MFLLSDELRLIANNSKSFAMDVSQALCVSTLKFKLSKTFTDLINGIKIKI